MRWRPPPRACAARPCARCGSPSSPRLSMDMIAGFGVGFVAMVLGLRLLWGELSLQTAMAVLLVAPEIFIPLRRAGAEFHASTEGQAAAARVLEVLGTPAPAPTEEATAATRSAATSPERPGPSRHRRPRGPLRAPWSPGDHFLHPPRGARARVALTGPSGSGKSTVLAALLRFVEPSQGTLTIDGRPAGAQTSAEWRSSFSWLPQRPHLFNATMAENLRLGAPEASEVDLLEVLTAVGLSEPAGQPAGRAGHPARPRRPHAELGRAAAGRPGPRPALPRPDPPARRADRIARPSHGVPRRTGDRTVARRPHRRRGGASAGPAPPLRHRRRPAGGRAPLVISP